MKLLFLKNNKNKTPKLESFKNKTFDVDKYWHILIISFLVSVILLGGIGAKFSYSIYSGNYTDDRALPDFSNLIKEVKLKTTMEQRREFINEPFVPIEDPSI